VGQLVCQSADVRQLRFRPPWYLRYPWLTLALLRVIGLIFDRRPLDVVQAVVCAILAALWWLALDTVVDDEGVSASGGWFRERITWSDVRRFAVDSASHKPVLVLDEGRRKRLAYVPDKAWDEVQLRWQRTHEDSR
jgi:hypothetical protein